MKSRRDSRKLLERETGASQLARVGTRVGIVDRTVGTLVGVGVGIVGRAVETSVATAGRRLANSGWSRRRRQGERDCPRSVDVGTQGLHGCGDCRLGRSLNVRRGAWRSLGRRDRRLHAPLYVE